MTRSSIALVRFTTVLTVCGIALAGCSSSGSAKTRTARTIQPMVETHTFSSAEMGGPEGFYDPFAAEVNAEVRAGVEDTTVLAGTNGGRAASNARVSIYGDVGQPAISAVPDEDGAENLMQVSFAGEGADFDPDVSGDGRFLVYASTQHRATADIYIKRTDSRAVTQLTADPSNDVMPMFSPDSQRVAFASDRDGSWDIFLINSIGGQAVQLTDDPDQELHPSWSPDGSKIVYCRLSSMSGRWEIWTVDTNRPAVRRFLTHGLFPQWSPTGEKLLFQRSRERGDRLFSVWTVDYVKDEALTPTEIISSSTAAIVNPTWSKDGKRIAFATIPYPTHKYGQRPEASDLWIVNLDGSGRANLTGGRFVNLMPAWGPNNRIYFVSDRGGRDNIWSLIPEKAILAATGPSGMTNNLATVPEGPQQDEDEH